MSTRESIGHVALLRGINVGGKNVLPMRDLVRFFTDAGAQAVRTYIQSGNVLFRAQRAAAAAIAAMVKGRIAEEYGYRVPLILRTAEELDSILHSNPFLQRGLPEKELHVYFLASAPDQTQTGSLDHSRSAPDAFRVVGREIYLHIPNGMGRTKLTNAYFDSRLDTVSTARNWATVQKLAMLLADV